MLNKLGGSRNSFEKAPESKFNKSKLAAALMAIILNQQPANASDNSNLAQALRSNQYPNNVKVYGEGKQIKGNVYNGFGLKFNSKNLEVTIEKGTNHSKYSAIIKKKLGTNGWIKGGGALLELKNFNVAGTKINPKQFSYGAEIGKTNENKDLYAAIGQVRSHLTGANNADGTSWVNYLELVKRVKTNIGQFDTSVSGTNAHALGETKNNIQGQVEYYPTEDTDFGVRYNSDPVYPEHDYKVSAGIQYNFGSGKNGHISPYFEGSYNLAGEHAQVFAKYQELIAKMPISWKDTFEMQININLPTAYRINQEEFVKKVKEAEKVNNNNSNESNETIYNAYWSKPLQSEVNNAGLEPGVISDASGYQVVINDLTDYTANLPAGSSFVIVSLTPNPSKDSRMGGFKIEGKRLIRDGPDTGYSRTKGTLTIQIVYPDGSKGPTATLNVEIANT